MEVLLIDDEKWFVELVQRDLNRVLKDVHMDHEETCELGISRLVAKAYDVVLMDYQLVGVQGLDCLRKIRKLQPELPVVMLTGYPSEKLKEECFAAGADDFVQKEWIGRLLGAAINSAIHRRHHKLRIAMELQAKNVELDNISRTAMPDS